MYYYFELFENRTQPTTFLPTGNERKNDMSHTEMSQFAELTRRFEQMNDWQSADGFVRLLKEIVLARQEGDLDDRDNLRLLIMRVEDRIIEVTKQEVDELIDDFEGFSPRALKRKRDNLLQAAPDAPTKRLNKFFQSQSWKIKDRLDKGSLEMAESYISTIENALKLVEEILAGDDKENNLRCMRANLDSVESAFSRIERTPHVKFVGMKLVAQKQEVSSATLLAYHKSRFETANAALTALEAAAAEKERQAAAMALEEKRKAHPLKARSLEEQRMNFTRHQIELEIEKAVLAIERRSKPAGKAARQFLDHIKQKNADAAWASLNEIRRYDGGVPKILQEEYQRAAGNTG
jgi:hypothetical protein